MRSDGNGGDSVNYEPNSFGGPVEDPSYSEPSLQVDGYVDRHDHRDGNDDYTQPGNLFRLMNKEEQKRLVSNIAEAMQNVPERIQARQVVHFYKADHSYGEMVAGALSLDNGKVHRFAEMSLNDLIVATQESEYR